jgi:hypothetical protein
MVSASGVNLPALDPRASTPDEFLQQMRAEIAQLRELGRVTGITLQD